MLFGFETVSVVDLNYSKYFWEEWNKVKSFSSAWLGASGRISYNQSLSVVACEVKQERAKNCLYNERFFYYNRVNAA